MSRPGGTLEGMSTPAAVLTELGDRTGSQREGAMRRFAVLRPHLEDGVPLARAAVEAGVACRTAQRWAAAYRDRGLAGLVRAQRSDAGHRRIPEELRHLVEGLALRRPAPHLTWVHRRAVEVAKDQGWPVPSYSTAYSIVRALDPAMVVLAHDETKRYREVYDVIHRREAEGPNAVWQARLTLAELDHALGAFFVGTYNQREHGETGQPPQARWEAGAFLPHMPDTLEQLDLLLLTVATPRRIHPDGIHFQSLRYLAPVLAAYVGEDVTIRYDPRDLAEIRVFHQDRYLTRAICPQLAGTAVSLKDMTAARNARRRELSGTLRQRTSVVDRLLAVHATPPGPLVQEPASGPEESRPKLRRYREE